MNYLYIPCETTQGKITFEQVGWLMECIALYEIEIDDQVIILGGDLYLTLFNALYKNNHAKIDRGKYYYLLLLIITRNFKELSQQLKNIIKNYAK